MIRLFQEVVARPVAMTMIFLAAVVFGAVSYFRLPVELMPDISYPTLTVRTTWDGAAPEEVESQVSRQIEARLATLDGLRSLESRSRAGGSDVVLGFDWGTDMSRASQGAREQLQLLWLPEGVDRPLLLRYDPNLEPFLRVAVSVDAKESDLEGEAALYTLREVAEREIRRELEGMDGVAAVQIRGGLERDIRVDVHQDWLAARRLTMEEVRSALAAANVDLAGGSILEGDREFLVRTLNPLGGVEGIRAVRIRRSDGELVALGEVADVFESHKDREVVSHLDGEEAVELEIFKEAEANIVGVSDRVKARLVGPQIGEDRPIADTLPKGMRLSILDDQATFISAAIRNVRDAAVIGGLLAVIVLYLFLRDFRSTLIIAIAIPIGVVVGFAPMYLLDVSLNLISLGGMALGIGNLVDNSVVVVEAVQRRRDDGEGVVKAAVHGTAEVAAAVVASTLTICAVFIPLGFVEGIAGELLGDLSVAVVGTHLVSLMVALFLVPMLVALDVGSWVSHVAASGNAATAEATWTNGRWWLTPFAVAGAALLPARAEWSDYRVSARERRWRWVFAPYTVARLLMQGFLALTGALLVSAFGILFRVGVVAGGAVSWVVGLLPSGAAWLFLYLFRYVEVGYDRVLPRVLRRPGLVISFAVVSLGLSYFGFAAVGTALIPEVHQGRFSVHAALPVGTPLAVTTETMSGAERVIANHPYVETVYATIGVDRTADADANEGPNTARLRVLLKHDHAGADDEATVMEDLRRELASVPRLEVDMVRPTLFSMKTPVEVVLDGWDLDDLRHSGDLVAARLSRIEGLRDVRSSMQKGNPEVVIRYDRERLHRLGLDPGTVARSVRDQVQGVVASEVHQGDQRLDVEVRLEEGDRAALDDLRNLNVNPRLVPPIPLLAVADVDEGYGPSEIRRVDQQRAVVVSANVEGFDLGSAGSEIEAALSQVRLEDGVTAHAAGQSAEMAASMRSLAFAFGLALFLVYVTMAITFENLGHPLVILVSVPLAVVGVALSLWVSATPASVMVLIGAIVLAGIVVNNAIVLVDCINRLRERGWERTAAIRQAGSLRLRPILITTITTVLGMLPMAMGFGEGAELQQPLAITIIGGLSSSTLLTLGVIPVIYRLFTRETQAKASVPEQVVGAPS